MPARDALDTSLVLIELLRAIPRKRFVTAVQLSQTLANSGHDRSLRSVQRLLDQLTDHFPSNAIPGASPADTAGVRIV